MIENCGIHSYITGKMQIGSGAAGCGCSEKKILNINKLRRADMAVKKIRVGIWGLGRAGLDMHCPELASHSDKFKIVAGCDVLRERLDELKRKYPGAKGYLNAEEFLADPSIDLIAVATPSLYHVDYDIRALEAGKYVFAENSEKCVQQGDIEGFRDFSHFAFCILHFMWIQPLYYIYYYNNIYNIKYL